MPKKKHGKRHQIKKMGLKILIQSFLRLEGRMLSEHKDCPIFENGRLINLKDRLCLLALTRVFGYSMKKIKNRHSLNKFLDEVRHKLKVLRKRAYR